MERVQFQQEQMLTELKDLVEKGLFTQKEVKQIMQKRTAFETALVRRVPKKSDFLRYAAYEMDLEALRRKRVERLKVGPSPPSVSDYALVRRQFHIFERALKKFKGDVGLWVQYIQVAKKEGARSLAGRITARALQLHPNVPALYILAASHELEHLSPSAARALLQRGLRLNADSVEMWREYVKMELGFVESLRRRWGVLGIDVEENLSKGKGTDKGKGKGTDDEEDRGSDHEKRGERGDGEMDKMEVDAEEEGAGEAARREIMQGAIVKSVISSAVKALPRISLFTSLHALLAGYPCPAALRNALLAHLFALLHATLPNDPAAIRLAATRRLLEPGVAGAELVEALRDANEALVGAVRERDAQGGGQVEELARVYTEFVREWCTKDLDDSLKGYLITSLQQLAMHSSAPPVLAACIILLASHQHLHALLPPSSRTPEKVLRLARKYTARAPTSAPVWLARLDAEEQLAGSRSAVERAWVEAREAVAGEGLEAVWVWGLDRDLGREADDREGEDGSEVSGAQARVRLLERLLKESSRIRDTGALRTVHEMLLVRYSRATHAELLSAIGEHTAPAQGTGTDGHPAGWSSAAARVRRVRHIGTAYLPSARVWREVFSQEAEAAEAGGCDHGDTDSMDGPDLDTQALETAYEHWRRVDGVDATLTWARWLLRHRRGTAATGVVLRTRAWLDREACGEVERRWRDEVAREVDSRTAGSEQTEARDGEAIGGSAAA
ncbi:hypothetical protein AcW1_009250 [Taiwanofungus camphoratus]|nr:hypothetical protein AcW1_009250 [Antrodia cinnamomea]